MEQTKRPSYGIIILGKKTAAHNFILKPIRIALVRMGFFIA